MRRAIVSSFSGTSLFFFLTKIIDPLLIFALISLLLRTRKRFTRWPKDRPILHGIKLCIRRLCTLCDAIFESVLESSRSQETMPVYVTCHDRR